MLHSYRKLEPHIINILAADFFLQLINSSFFLLLNYYMVKQGYEDYLIADFVSYRFLAIMIFAFPFGIFIKGRKLKPFFFLAAIFTPMLGLVIIYAIDSGLDNLLYFSMGLWGVSFTLLHITALPFILLNAKKETHSEAIALVFMMWSLSITLCGLINFGLNRYFAHIFNEKLLLQIFCLLGFISIYFVSRIRIKEKVSSRSQFTKLLTSYDWMLIFKALLPTLIIAIGAGFTIPFINLFFFNVHGIQADTFSIMGAFTYTLVMIGILIIPTIKRKFGYKIAITFIQSLSVIALIFLATTEFYSHLGFAVYLAVFFYVIRQPLMNVAGPMTSELTMYYVGTRNQELVSALTSSVWSGSWFISSQIFRILRSSGFSYARIFLITAGLYTFGVFLYYLLIKDYYKRKKLGLTDL